MGGDDPVGAADAEVGDGESAVGTGGCYDVDTGVGEGDGDAGAGEGFAFAIFDDAAEGGGGDLAIGLIDRE